MALAGAVLALDATVALPDGIVAGLIAQIRDLVARAAEVEHGITIPTYESQGDAPHTAAP